MTDFEAAALSLVGCELRERTLDVEHSIFHCTPLCDHGCSRLASVRPFVKLEAQQASFSVLWSFGPHECLEQAYGPAFAAKSDSTHTGVL